MAKFRMIHTEFWDDPKVVEEMTPEDKFFFLYLLTNSNTTQIGIYQITKKQIAFDMGYSIESVNALLERFINHHKIVVYNQETRELAIKNWGRYNFNRGGKPILDCVSSELKMVKDISLIKTVGERVERAEIKKIYESYYVTCSDTSTISGQEKEQQQEEEKEKEEEKQQEQEEQSSMSAVDFYQKNFGVLNPFIGECISKWVQDLTEELVIEAMKRALAQQKKWKYAEGILKNWANRNINSLKDVQALDLEFTKSRDKPKGFKPLRTEILPDWWTNENPYQDKQQEQQKSPEELEAKKQEIDEMLKEFDQDNEIEIKKQRIQERLEIFRNGGE
ncbi:DnaD domain protein [Neobacillus sp. WH10]|uniref:DnaD domain-containing protein n=1 Tax=Neobacillus sp. WH10 TaxID=3047873 RepID=UPI0024C147BF|nr:DnaD domain protein [Neobacillus sp. WH10]WHY76258.1 DnaD domain protein [Neobacillus sp. WH10]